MSDSNDRSNDHNDDCSYYDPKKSMEFSPSVIEALAEYMQEQTEKLLREDLLKHRSEEDPRQIPDIPFDENWQLSQFWYNDDTIKALVKGALNSTPANGKIALISCPSLYSRLKKECGERQIMLFEYDDRFKIFGTDFIQYDYNSPLDISRDMASQFDLVIADPPYFAEECLTKTAVTIKFLTKKNIVLCTGVIMAELAKKLLGVKKCYFIPDGNISMEEDTELRDLVVQTLESNGVLAKIRAELRASVFLALEEQDSVMNPEPLLNKTVKQYLSNSEGKLLFSLVREFLEYFGLDYTISVYDPETYFGKEYNYVGRNKLCEELGIDSTEPLLGEILKNSINGAFNSSQKNKTSNRHDETDEISTNFANATFEVSVPKIIHNESVSSSNDNDSSEKLESISEQSPKVPINVTITDKKCKDPPIGADVVTDTSDYDKHQSSLRESTTDTDGIEGNRNNNINFDKSTANPHDTCTATNDVAQETDSIITSNQMSPLNKSESLIKFDDSIVIDKQANQNKDVTKQNSINSLELSIENNVQSKKPVNMGSNFGKTIYFDEIIVGGERKNVSTMNKAEPFLEGLPTINQKANSIFSDLPPLNGKKANINDLKELMNIGLATDGVDNYEEDFVSSASGSANEQSPTKEPDKLDSPLKLRMKKEEKPQSARTEDLSEEIEEMDEILSSTSCLSSIFFPTICIPIKTQATGSFLQFAALIKVFVIT